MNDREKAPLVSVLVTSYNREKYICAAVDSILNQKFQSFEIIICDNCSTDNTMEVIKKYSGLPGVRIYRNETNIGQFPNRNKIASYARGKYLKYVDSDDLIYPTCLDIMVDSMEKFPEAGWGLFSDQDDARPQPFLLSPREAYEYHYFTMPIFERSPLGAIIKKSAFEAVGGFKDINMAGDFEMWHRLACSYPVVLIGNGLGWYRVHDSQEMNRYSYYLGQYSAVRTEYLTSRTNPLEDSVRRNLIAKEKSGLLKQAIKNVFKGKFGKSKKLIQLRTLYHQSTR